MPKWFTTRWKVGVLSVFFLYSAAELTRYIIQWVLKYHFEWRLVGEMAAFWFCLGLGLYGVYLLGKGKW